MRNFEFTLKSGAHLQITIASFELAIALVEAVKKVSKGEDPEHDITGVVIANAEVRKALFVVCDTVLYETVRVTPALFDDPKLGEKARGDYFEICARVIEVNTKPFFLKTSSESTTSAESEASAPGSQ